MSGIQSPKASPGVRCTWVAELPRSLGSIVRVSGFVETIRDQKRMQFLVVRDRTGTVQLTHEKAGAGNIAERIATLTPGSAISATARAVAAEQVRLGGIELIVEAIEIASIADTPLPIAADSALERQIDWAEPSSTTRHETEFTLIDMELSWIASHDDVMQMEERWLAHSLTAVAAEHGADIKRLLGVEVTVPAVPFPRVTFAEARSILRGAGVAPAKADHLGPEGERALPAHVAAQDGHEFVFVTDYPASGRAFYHMRHEDRPDASKGFDLLWKGLEITTGAQGEHRYDRLVEQAVERGYALEPLSNYLAFFRYGCPPHGGAGIGLGRLLMVLLGRQSIREVTLVSRTPTRLEP